LAIKGTVQLMINENPSLSNEIEYIPMILKSIDRLDDTIQEILTYSRNSRLEVSIEEIDVKQMIQEHFNDLHNFNDSKIELQYTSTCESLIRTDKMRVSAIIKNILSNAVKYSNQTNRTPIIKCNVSCINNFYIFEISDNGMGIEEEHLPHIFNMFYRATSKTIGTGLGLYIVKEALNKLNGTIRIESKVNVGTKVTIEIPRQSETTPQIKYLYN
jgi:signal transduction histidine kinase